MGSHQACHIQVSNCEAAFTLMHVVLLELDTYHYHLDIKLLNEKNNVVPLKTFLVIKWRLWVYTITKQLKFMHV